MNSFQCVCGGEEYVDKDGVLRCERCSWPTDELRILVRVGDGGERWIPLLALLEVLKR